MSRGISPNSTNHELINCYKSCRHIDCNHDMLCNLKVEVFAKDQNKKNFANLLSMFHNLEEEIKILSEQKKKFEIDLGRLESDERNYAIIELKNKNENLFNEINEKIALNKKLYCDNNQLFQELECQTSQIENSKKLICEQEESIRRLKNDKEEIQSKILCLSQIKEKGENNLFNLNIKINDLNIQNEDKENILKKRNSQNYDIINNLDEEKNINRNLKIELRTVENNLGLIQQKLNMENNNINLLQNKIKNLDINLKKEYGDISVINNDLLKEESLLNQLNRENQKLNHLISDKEECIKKINNDNDLNKQNNTDINNDNNKISNLLKEYQKYMNLLICQNKKICCEMKFLLSRDSELRTILDRDNHLIDIRNENEHFMNNSIEKNIENINSEFQNESQIKTNKKITYSLDGNNGME